MAKLRHRGNIVTLHVIHAIALMDQRPVCLRMPLPDYDFHTLSPADFETLTRDLLQARDGVTWESFKAGRDGGVDLRRSHGPDQSIVQCKHYSRSGYDALLRDLRKEVAKLPKLRTPVKRYIVSTSVDLSLVQKDEIAEVFGSICTTEDVLGRDDLNNLLARHADVEKQHFKLWLSSTEVLNRVLHNAEQNQSDFEVRRVHKNIKRFVRTSAYPEAREKLARERIVILSGSPGIGKTTLAEMLVYEQLEAGAQAIVARNDLREARKLYVGDGAVIFYYDDFLGATFLGDAGSSLKANEDRAIVDFIEFVLDTPQAKLVLTTREHLFVQARGSSERLRHAMVDRHKLMVTMKGLTRKKRAQILYNHIHFGDLPPEYRKALLADEFYLEIIRHEKFSPRLVQWLCSYDRVRAANTSDYRTFVRDLLKDPSEIWRHAYEKQISDAGRSLLLSLFSLTGEMQGVWLKDAFDALHIGRSREYGFARGPGDFEAALQELTGTFVKIEGRSQVSFLDPSVMDLMNAVLRREPDNALDIIRNAIALLQIRQCWALASTAPSSALKSAMIARPDIHQAGLQRIRESFDPSRVGPLGATREALALMTIQIARASGSSMLDMVAPAVTGLCEEWSSRDVADYAQGVEIIRVLRAAGWPPSVDATSLADRLTDELLSMSEHDLDPTDALALLEVCSPRNPKVRAAITSGISWWRSRHFGDQVSQLSTSSELGALLNQLEELRGAVDLDLGPQIYLLEQEKAEAEEHEEEYADAHQDEYRERWRDDRADQESVRDLFDSLSLGDD